MFVTKAFAQEAAQEAVEAAHGAAEAAHGAEGAFPPFDASTYPSQLFWLALTFGFLFWFMSKIIVPRIGGILEMRQDRIAQDLDKAHELKSEADEAIAADDAEADEQEKLLPRRSSSLASSPPSPRLFPSSPLLFNTANGHQPRPPIQENKNNNQM